MHTVRATPGIMARRTASLSPSRALINIDNHVPLLRNKRAASELPGGQLELGKSAESKPSNARVREEMSLTVKCRTLVNSLSTLPARR